MPRICCRWKVATSEPDGAARPCHQRARPPATDHPTCRLSQRLDLLHAAYRSRTRLALEGACVATALRRLRAVVHREGMEQAPGADLGLEHGGEQVKAAETKPAIPASVEQRR